MLILYKKQMVLALIGLMMSLLFTGCSQPAQSFLAADFSEENEAVSADGSEKASEGDSTRQEAPGSEDGPILSADGTPMVAEQEASEENLMETGSLQRADEVSGKTNVGTVHVSGAAGMIYICGAVAKPGVYAFSEGERVCDAVRYAGGLTEQADEKRINGARYLTDGETIIVPEIGETLVYEEKPASGQLSAAGMPTGSGTVNINTAGRDELMTLSGIGEAKAEAIIAYREANGAFSTTEAITAVPGIGESIFNRLKDRITV
ncbi:MAG: helix-hairpin-helix domain-containing protein [Lachnospiraceae bacterium]|nr:helix-hairpin-helix domain-containing protein [Lachnospiraceae bacterium]